jgi:hypothetical protein
MEKSMKKTKLIVVVLILLFEQGMSITVAAEGRNTLPTLVIVDHQWYQQLPSQRERENPFEPTNNSSERNSRHFMASILRDSQRSNDQGVDQFVYQIRLQNSGDKVIKAVSWNYVFNDPETKKELSRHIFYNELILKPKQSKTIEAVSLKPPTNVISIETLTNGKDPYQEIVEIKQIFYTDGSSWKLP